MTLIDNIVYSIVDFFHEYNEKTELLDAIT